MTAPWLRVRVVRLDLPRGFDADGTLRTDAGDFVVPADPRCVVTRERDDGQARSRWRDMTRMLSAGGRARIRVADGRMVALGQASALVHDVDMAILAALGLDAEGAMDAMRDGVHWVAPDMQLVHEGGWPRDFQIDGITGRFTATFEIDGGATYEGGALSLRERVLPDAAMAALVGRPLRDLVDIPALGGMDLPIVGVENQPSAFSGMSRTHVVLSDGAGWRELL